LKDSPPVLRATGNIEMSGPLADARRDLAHMISEGHVDAVSIRWDEVPGKSIARVNLPKEHPYFVDGETERGEKRYGIYFEEWVAREGSIVALGADRDALIGRAEETGGTFYRALADDITPSDAEMIAEIEPVEVLFDVPDAISKLREDAAQVLAAGASVADVINAVAADNESTPIAEALQECHIGDSTVLLPGPIADQLEDERETARELAADVEVTQEPDLAPVVDIEPEPDLAPDVEADQPARIDFSIGGIDSSIDTSEFGQMLVEAMDAQEARIRKTVQGLIDLSTGKV
jgi:hypothetical protein